MDNDCRVKCMAQLMKEKFNSIRPGSKYLMRSEMSYTFNKISINLTKNISTNNNTKQILVLIDVNLTVIPSNIFLVNLARPIIPIRLGLIVTMSNSSIIQFQVY